MSESHGTPEFSHPMSPVILLAVFGALIFLTVVTVAVVDHPLIPKGYDVIIALSIATVKASLVVLFFMHMIHDKGMNAIFFVFSLVFVALFLSSTITDSEQYQHRIQEYELVNPDSSM